MKIALLTEVINRKSGARAPLEIAKALKKNGVDVTVFAYKNLFEQESAKELVDAQIAVVTLDQSRILAPFIIAKLLRNGKFDIVSFHGTLPFFLGALFAKIPIVRTYYGTHHNTLLDHIYDRKPSLRLLFVNALASLVIHEREKFMSRHAIRITAISKCMQSEHKKLYGKATSLIYLGNSPSGFIARKKSNQDSVSILSVSRIVPYKGFHTLIRIFNILNKKYPKTKLFIAGSTPDQSYFTYLQKIAGKNVVFNTNITDEKLKERYQTADIYATLDRSLVFSLTLLEAATFSLPCVALNICSAKEEVVHEKTGYLADSQEEFKKYLVRLIVNKRLRKRMGEHGKAYVRRFSWDTLAKQYLEVFKTI